MAFFSKPPAKKPAPEPKPDVRARPGVTVGAGRAVSARELASQVAKSGRSPVDPGDITGSGASLVQWTPAQAAFEVAQANPGLCAVLENAALRFASGQGKEARELLEDGIENDTDTKMSPLAWLALFDLLQRGGDRAAFDALSLKYVVQFERSAPAWIAKANAQAGPRVVAGYVAVTGRLTAASEKQIDGLRRAIARKADATRLDLMSLQSFDDVGAQMLAECLSEARRGKVALQVQQGPKLQQALGDALKKGRDAGQGAWLLALELLQWANDRASFEDRAVDFAVTFELSPPSWEPPVPAAAAKDKAAPADNAPTDADTDPEVTKWSGVLSGSHAPQLGKFADCAHGRSVVVVDMSEVERIDFVCAGAFQNHITRIEQQRKAVQIVGVTPIVRALLLLLGVSPRHFVKKAE
ncbi:MAG TPA: STAS domain-containing protein [Casimicrobiaceae bacterium]|nr:STAS domain-containing protein [Casimicrobiaceae bacterium]